MVANGNGAKYVDPYQPYIDQLMIYLRLKRKIDRLNTNNFKKMPKDGDLAPIRTPEQNLEILNEQLKVQALGSQLEITSVEAKTMLGQAMVRVRQEEIDTAKTSQPQRKEAIL